MSSFVVQHQSALTAWGQVQRELRRRVDDREFRVGRRIPAEAELMEEFGVSRITVRRAIAALEADGYLEARRGSGTYVSERSDALRLELDITLPWRDQLISRGHHADSALLDVQQNVELPPSLRAILTHQIPERVTFGRHLEKVDAIPIALTDSWVTDAVSQITTSADGTRRPAAVVSSIAVETGFASTEQAALLRTYLDAPLFVSLTISRLARDGTYVEVARTFWLGSRVRFRAVQNLTLDHVDMSRLLSAGRD
jgi:DNA-binding GntR family transcriptional regulator